MPPQIWTTDKYSTSWCGLSSSRVIVSDEVLTQKHRSWLGDFATLYLEGKWSWVLGL